MALPALRQLFVAAIGLDGAALEGRLLVLRRIIERDALTAGIGRDRFHWASLSSRTVVYKGMLTAAQLAGFYPDLLDERVTSTLALVHARFSTNVLPRWDLAQPFRMSAHNGEINTLRGNVNWMRARQSKFRSPHFGDDIAKLMPRPRRVGLGLLAVRQRARAARHDGQADRARHDDDDPRGVASERPHGR